MQFTYLPQTQTRLFIPLVWALASVALAGTIFAQESPQPSKETLVKALQTVVEQIEAKKFAETEKYFYLPEDFEHRMFAVLIKRGVISRRGVEALVLGGEFGKAVGVLKKSEVEAVAGEFAAPVEQCYAMKMKQGDQRCKVVAHWTGEYFKILDINRVGKMDPDKLTITVQAPLQPWPTGEAPTKELLIKTLKVFLHQIENRHYEALRPNVYVPDDFVMSRFSDSLERDELSAKGIEVLAQKGAFGKAEEVYPKLRAAALTKRVNVPVDESYGFVARIADEQGEVLAHWIGDRYKLIRADDVGKLPAALAADSKVGSTKGAIPVEIQPATASKPVAATPAMVEPSVADVAVPSSSPAALPTYETDKAVVIANYPTLMKAAADNATDISIRARFVQGLLVIGNTPKAWQESVQLYQLDPNHIEVIYAIDQSIEGLKKNGIFQVGVPQETIESLMGKPAKKVTENGLNRWEYPNWSVEFNDGRFVKLTRVAPAVAPANKSQPVAEAKVEPVDPARFGVKLLSYEKRLNAVHLIRLERQIGLKETMKLIEKLPAVIFEGMEKTEAESWVAKCAEKGMVAELFEMNGNAEPLADAPSTFSVEMSSFGTNKIAVIKVIREFNKGMRLLKAKQLTENVPSIVLEGVSKEKATEAMEKLTAAGAAVKVK